MRTSGSRSISSIARHACRTVNVEFSRVISRTISKVFSPSGFSRWWHPTACVVTWSAKSSQLIVSAQRRQKRKIALRCTSGRANATSGQAAMQRAGCLQAKASAIIPPIEVPCTSTRSSPTASSSAAPSSAQPSMVYFSLGTSERP